MSKTDTELLDESLEELPNLPNLSNLKIPEHIAIIMDGNGRWAQKRGEARIRGHRAGADSIERVLEACADVGVKFLTLYAFSSQNWCRPKSEVNALMRLLHKFLLEKADEIDKKNIRLRAIGRINLLPKDTLELLKKLERKTASNDKLTLILALSYGGREEIVDAAKSLAQKCQTGELNWQDIDKKKFANHLYTKDTPDPDLLLRSSGESRLSNFLLWQLSYSEIIISPKLWPDFQKEDIYQSVCEFNRRQRRFGLTEAQLNIKK